MFPLLFTFAFLAIGVAATVFSVLVVALSLVPFVMVLVPLFQQHQRGMRLLSAGQVAPAQVLSLRDTGVQVNHRPQVELTVKVQPGAGESFQSRCVKVFDFSALAQIQPGTVIEVRYDPEDTSLVAFVGI